MRLPDFARSRAVLIGTATYDRDILPDLPAVAHNVAALRDRLTDPTLSGFPAAHCVSIVDPKHPGQVLAPVQAAAEQAQDLLFVYFAGHGLLDREGELHLGLRLSHEQQPWTSVRFAQLAEQILDSGARSKIVVLDCCYSGRALQHLHMADDRLVARATAQLDIDGLYVLTSSSGNKTSLAPEGHEFTAFTGRMLEFVDAGVPGPQPLLTMQVLYTAVRDEMQRRKMPRPQQHCGNLAGEAALVRNRAFVPAPPPDPVVPPKPHEPRAAEDDSRPKPTGAGAIRRGCRRTFGVALCAAALSTTVNASAAANPAVLPPCAAPTSVRMLVPIDTVAMFSDIADDYEYAARGAGHCQRVRVNVAGASPADAARAFALSWRTPPDAAERDGQLLRRVGLAPDVWVGDLGSDMAAVQATLAVTAGAGVRIPGGPATWPTAESPVVLAVPGEPRSAPAPGGLAPAWTSVVAGRNNPPRLRITGVVRPDPDTTTVGRLVNVALYPPGRAAAVARRDVQQPLDAAASDAGAGIGAPDVAALLCGLRGTEADAGGADRRTGLVVAEWQVVRHNHERGAGGRCGAAGRDVPLNAWYPRDTRWLDYPMVEPVWTFAQSERVRRAARDLTTWLRSDAGTRALAGHGLRPRNTRPVTGVVGANGAWDNWFAKQGYAAGAADLERARLAYEAAKKPATVLVAIDGSGSMTGLSGRRTRFAAAVDGIAASIATMGPRDAFGLIVFSTAIKGDVAEVAGLGSGTVHATRSVEKARAYRPAGGTPLYRAVDHGVRMLRAHGEVPARTPAQQKADGGRYRILVVLTDGKDTTGHALPRLDGDEVRVVVVNVGLSGCPDPRLSALTSAHGACIGVPSDRVDVRVGEQIERLWQKEATS